MRNNGYLDFIQHQDSSWFLLLDGTPRYGRNVAIKPQSHLLCFYQWMGWNLRLHNSALNWGEGTSSTEARQQVITGLHDQSGGRVIDKAILDLEKQKMKNNITFLHFCLQYLGILTTWTCSILLICIYWRAHSVEQPYYTFS